VKLTESEVAVARAVRGDVVVVYEGDKPPAPGGRNQADRYFVNGTLILLTGGIGWLARHKVWQWIGGDDTRLPIVFVRLDDALAENGSGHAKFPTGHPQSRHVYARHPLHEARYVRYSNLHRQVLTEKINQGVKLLLALGAKEIDATWVTTSGKTGDLNLSPSALDKATGHVGWEAKSDGSFTLHMKGDGMTSRVPKLPWMGHDPAFDTAIDAARSGMSEWSAVFRSEESSTVTASLAATLREAMDLSIGGTYGAWDNVSVKCSASF